MINLYKFFILSATLLAIGQNSFAARFTISPDGTEVSDSQTNLTWRRCLEGTEWSGISCDGVAISLSWNDALSYSVNQRTLDGLKWRLPNVKEIKTISSPVRKSPTTDMILFPNITGFTSLWTSTPYTGDTTRAWDFKADLGIIFHESITSTKNIIFVRDGGI